MVKNVFGRNWREELASRPKAEPNIIDGGTGKVLTMAEIEESRMKATLDAMINAKRKFDEAINKRA